MPSRLTMFKSPLNAKVVDFQTMAKFSGQIKMMVYRFITSLLVGFFLGTCFITYSDNTVLKSLGAHMCRRSPHLSSKGNPMETPSGPMPRLNAKAGILYIGMMSTKINLDTRVAAVLDTWANHPNVKLEIFSNNYGTLGPGSRKITTLKQGAKIISLPGVEDTTYPPQKKSFSMMKYIHDNHLQNFNWFLRVDDDAYVKIDALTKYLSKIDPSKRYFIGRAGYGKHADDYLFGENYCMGGPGILFSKEMLRSVGPKLSECLQEMYTEHEDIELGRCVRKMTGVSCTTAWQTSNLFYQNYGDNRSYDDNIKDISERQRAVALTFHANKNPAYQFKLHVSILQDQVTDTLTRITKKETEKKKMSDFLVIRKFDDKSWNAHEGYVWDSITPRSMYSATSQQLVRQIPTAIKDAAMRNVLFTIGDLHSQYEALFSHIDDIVITNTRYYVNPFTSADMISKLKVRTTAKNLKKYVYVNNTYFRRTFPDTMLYFAEDNAIQHQLIREKSQKEEYKLLESGIQTGNVTRVNFIVALSGRLENLRRFLNNYREVFLAIRENVSLTKVTIVCYPQKTNPKTANSDNITNSDSQNPQNSNLNNDTETIADTEFVQNLLNDLQHDYPGTFVRFIPVKNESSFSRGDGLQIGAESVARNELMFFCDVDLVFSSEILFHIRRGTVQRKQVYYPIFFSQYDPDIVYSYHEPPDTSFYFEENAGFWRTFSYGMVAIYKSDFLATGGFDLSIRGWGLEDVRFCDAVLEKAGLQVFRANEPAMVHIYHDKVCPSDLSAEQRNSCQKSRAQHFGPKTLMYYLWQREKVGDALGENDHRVEVDNEVQESPVAAK